MNKKLCYILPIYDRDTDTHFSYLYDLLELVSSDLDLFLIIEKAKSSPKFQNARHVEVVKTKGIFFRFFEILSALRKARLRGYRDVYVHYSFMGALAGIFVGMRVFYWNCGMPWLYKRNFIREALFKYILRHSILVTGTNSIGVEYARHYGLEKNNIKILSNWIDIDNTQCISKEKARHDVHIPLEKKIILFVHHLSARKGADKIIPTALSLSIPDSLFLVAGDGPMRSMLEEEIVEKGLEEKIRFLGPIPHKDISHYFSAADVFFMPSEEEGFPHVLLEAMVCGVPFVASDVGGVMDIVPNVQKPYILSDSRPENFASHIKSILANPPMKEELTNHMRAFDIKVVKDQFISLF